MNNKAVMTDLDVREKGGGGTSTTTPTKRVKASRDKYLHVGVSFGLMGALTALCLVLGLGKAASIVVGFFATLLIGAGKESYDAVKATDTKAFNFKDIIADLVGIVLGVVVLLVVVDFPFDYTELLHFSMGCGALFVFFVFLGTLGTRMLVDRKEILYPQYGKKWFRHF